MWDLIVSVPDHSLSFYFSQIDNTVTLTLNGDSIDLEQPNRGNKFDYKHRGCHIANLNIRHIKPKIDNMKLC